MAWHGMARTHPHPDGGMRRRRRRKWLVAFSVPFFLSPASLDPPVVLVLLPKSSSRVEEGEKSFVFVHRRVLIGWRHVAREVLKTVISMDAYTLLES